jgi:hypothetical protein
VHVWVNIDVSVGVGVDDDILDADDVGVGEEVFENKLDEEDDDATMDEELKIVVEDDEVVGLAPGEVAARESIATAREYWHRSSLRKI